MTKLFPLGLRRPMFCRPVRQLQSVHRVETHKLDTFPPMQVTGRVQFDVELNRGHVVLLHPAAKVFVKKKTGNAGNEPSPS